MAHPPSSSADTEPRPDPIGDQCLLLNALFLRLRHEEVSMNDDDHIGFAMLCSLVFAIAIVLLAGGDVLGSVALAGCLAVGIPVYYTVHGFRARRSWYWESVRRSLTSQDIAGMWAHSERGDWMLWFAAHMIGKKDWPTHQQVVLAACQCARTALKHIPDGEARPALAIRVTEEWCEGKATLEQVRAAANALYGVTQDDTVYCAGRAAYSAAWAVFATEDGRSYRLPQAAGDAASRAAYASDLGVMRDRFDLTDYDGRKLLAVAAQEQSLRESAAIIRSMIRIPDKLLDDVSPYKLVRRWRTNSHGDGTGHLDRIPVLISQKVPGSATIKGALTYFERSGIVRGLTLASAIFAVVLLIQALDGGSAESFSRLRAVVTYASVLLIARAYLQGTLKPAYALVPVAVLFNQVFPVHIQADRVTVAQAWHVIDILAAAVLVVVAVALEVDVFLSRRVKLQWK